MLLLGLQEYNEIITRILRGSLGRRVPHQLINQASRHVDFDVFSWCGFPRVNFNG